MKKWFLAAVSYSLGEGLRLVTQAALDIWLGWRCKQLCPTLRGQQTAVVLQCCLNLAVAIHK